MLDIGWMELLVVGIVALIVVGPKDLPKMFRTLGQMTAKARGMAREFQRAMDDAADSTGMKDVARDLRKATDPQGMGLDELNKMRNWDPLKDDAKPKDKTGTPKPSMTQEEEDEAAMDMVSAEMDALRKSRAAKADAERAAADPAPAAPPEPQASDATPAPTDKGNA